VNSRHARLMETVVIDGAESRTCERIWRPGHRVTPLAGYAAHIV